MKITICDLRDDCVTALDARFKGVADVTIRKADLTKLRADAWGTAGNSFGDMGGGVDRAIDQHFNGQAQRLVQEAIRVDFFGELPVGSAIVVRPDQRQPALIYAPTMRVPGRLGPTINAYLAARAMLMLAVKNGFATFACPVFGTGVGGLMPQDAADQMFQAHRLIVQGEWKLVLHSMQAPYIMR
jgi:O-acetyl-ADP-ribose deacetylase (regulator of RNase III)